MKKVWQTGIAYLVNLILPLVIALPAHAQPNLGIKTADDFVIVICNVAGWMFVFLIVISIISVIIASYYYVVSGGDADRVSTARRMIMYTAIAILVAMLAKALPFLVAGVGGVKIQSKYGC